MAKKSKKTTSKAPKQSAKAVEPSINRKKPPATTGRGEYQLVIVESPAKAKTIEKYLGKGFVVRASIGHIRDLPRRAEKGLKQPVPGVDLTTFEPTYVVDDAKLKTVSELKKLAKSASEVWFATDLDREGEAIAWHLAVILGISPHFAKRVVFDAVTKADVAKAFERPRAINMNRVDAQQARRILDRIVGYLVSPVLWKKVAGGLSAGRVQSPATRLIVDREREIAAFTPAESWTMHAAMALDAKDASTLIPRWNAFQSAKDERGRGPLIREQMAWLAQHKGLECELVEVDGAPFKIETPNDSTADLAPLAARAAEAAGFVHVEIKRITDETARGRAKSTVKLVGKIDPAARYKVDSIETTRTRSKPYPPFTTSTLQQAAAGKLGFATSRTMRIAQQLYEGIEVPGEDRVGLISYMRTDSTHLSSEAISKGRAFIESQFGKQYLPDSPRRYSKSHPGAQEAHEAIRPTDPARTPDSLASSLNEEQHKLYTLIWRGFIACQMVDAQWDATAIRLVRSDKKTGATFKANGRVLVFDGCYRASGMPTSDSEQTLPTVTNGHVCAPFSIDPEQKFSSPPPRFTEASLVKTLEEEGIGRPSTYASIIKVIQDREYVEQVERRFHAMDLGTAVIDFLAEEFKTNFVEIDYTRRIEAELDAIAQGNEGWKTMLKRTTHALQPLLKTAMAADHVKSIRTAARYACPLCGSRTEYRLGKGGRFLSCSSYPTCKYANGVDREGRPVLPEQIDLLSPSGVSMIKRHGKFGDFLVEDLPRPEKPKKSRKKPKAGEPVEVVAAAPKQFILNIDRKGCLKLPSAPPLVTALCCPKCTAPMNLRDGKRGPWLGCSKFPKCRGRESFAKLPEDQQAKLQKQLDQHMKGFSKIVVTRHDGEPVPEGTPIELLSKVGGVQELAIHHDAIADIPRLSRAS